ncbi:pyruvate ferredoxin oxidoreductase [Pseudodesulfovibrio sp. JC047]|uniref:2-oxoacid:acceptor oxidoreductase family protein n=1 Tax=Pseudodesulfovibrio sp. JC047 TaxID=2683199 RepID=UPI0013D14A82|nr:2-oxoacid:acceptor oxidoreductase family protein [Pseudodesulfovibrio sp. JC047]NDV19489.1 pyruvate ferredoxin oxidoreductase [Pseudodesulfovibrio sp. JC047]
MKYKCAFSGSGGQGAALMAKLTCYAGIKESKQVVMTQTYGVEQRGGDSTGFVIVSDDPIGNPIVESDADIGVAMSESIYQASLEGLKDGGVLFVNSSMVKTVLTRPEVTQVLLPVSGLAQDMGNVRVANIIMLGAVVQFTKMLSIDSIIAALTDAMGKKKASLLEINIQALNAGIELAEKEAAK